MIARREFITLLNGAALAYTFDRSISSDPPHN
jgi:hypothetical protein